MAAGVAIIGGGIAGLAAAHRVTELASARSTSVPLVLLEATSRLGGTIASERVDGFLVEAGADSFLTEKPWALELCRRLGLEERLISTRDRERRTFVVRAGRLHVLPEGFLLMAPTELWPLVRSPLFTWRGKVRMALDVMLPRGRASSDESLASFVTRRLGREALERVAQPLVGGIYASDPQQLSLAATMPRFLDMERRHRSVILAMRRERRVAPASGSGARWSLFASFADGMQVLIDSLARRLPEGALRLGTRATTVAASAPGWRITLADGGTVEAAAVIVATPAFAAADLLHGVDGSLAQELDAVPYASSVTVTLGYARADVPHPLDGFGFIVPAVEGRDAIAGSFSSVKYAGRAPADAALVRVFLGGAIAEEVVARSDAELIATARSELRELLGITAAPRLARAFRYPRSMPQYRVGHLERVARVEAALAHHRGLALAGNAYRGVGLPDCVHSGELAAERVMATIG